MICTTAATLKGPAHTHFRGCAYIAHNKCAIVAFDVIRLFVQLGHYGLGKGSYPAFLPLENLEAERASFEPGTLCGSASQAGLGPTFFTEPMAWSQEQGRGHSKDSRRSQMQIF